MAKSGYLTEFLMTYGWAIIVVLITVGALVYFGTFERDEVPVPDNESIQCEKLGGTWVNAQVGGFLDLEVNTAKDCALLGGFCGEPRIISSFTIGMCDKSNECWKQDIWEPTCVIKAEDMLGLTFCVDEYPEGNPDTTCSYLESPVCGNNQQTYSNGCVACLDEVSWYTEGGCDGELPETVTEGIPEIIAEQSYEDAREIENLYAQKKGN